MNGLALVRVLDGAVLVGVASRLAHRGDGRGALAARVLAGRQIVQARLLWNDPSPGALRVGAAIDALHGTSMITLAALDRERRAPGLAAGASAILQARAGLALSRRG